MNLWIDAQLPPAIAPWIAATFGISVQSLRDIGLRDAKDVEIFQAARLANAAVMTKDADFVELVERLGTPPQVLWIRCGNTTNARLRDILTKCFPFAMPLLQQGEPVIEIDEAL